MFILVNFLGTAKNNFRKINGFRGFWVKVDKSEWVLSKSKIAKKCCHEGTKTRRFEGGRQKKRRIQNPEEDGRNDETEMKNQ